MNALRSCILPLSALVVFLTFSAPADAEPVAQGGVADDWLEVEAARCKLFLPGAWGYEVTSSPEGALLEAHGGEGRLLLRAQSIEGKETATPEKLREIFEEHIVAGASARSVEPAGEGLKGRYVIRIEGQDALFKALFLRHQGTGYMVYLQALMQDVRQDAGLEKIMDSILASLQPL